MRNNVYPIISSSVWNKSNILFLPAVHVSCAMHIRLRDGKQSIREVSKQLTLTPNVYASAHSTSVYYAQDGLQTFCFCLGLLLSLSLRNQFVQIWRIVSRRCVTPKSVPRISFEWFYFFFFCCFYRWLLSRRQPCQMEMEASEKKKTICVNDRRVSSLLGSLKFSLENILFFFSTVFFLYFGSSAYFFCLCVHSVSSAYISQH